MKESREAMEQLKVRLCIDRKMTVTEMNRFTGMSIETIQKVLDEVDELGQAHTFSMLTRTNRDERLVERRIQEKEKGI